jgi:HJR/Mrr/RecB family endonuclease
MKPLSRFLSYRATASPTDFPDRHYYEQFLDQERRRERRSIDIPDPAYQPGLLELNNLIDDLWEANHDASFAAALASMEVDLDWYDKLWRMLGTTQFARQGFRMQKAIETVAAYLEKADSMEQVLHAPSLEPIRVAVVEVSRELLKYLGRHPNEMYRLRPRQFEKLIAEILKGFGWDVELTPETKDGGYDILAVSKDVDGSGVRTSYIVECKKYGSERKVGVAVARQLLQVKSEVNASHAMLVTTSDFTHGVYEYQRNRLDFDAKNLASITEWCRHHARRATERP